MIVEQHYDEEVLIGLMEEADHDSHVPSCETCAGTLESFRDLTGALRDNSVWDERPLSETPAPQTRNMIRAFAAQTRAEDAAARPIVAKLVAASAEERTALLAQNPGWRTAGVVRGLLAHFDTITYTDPKAAVDLSTLAVEIAETIDTDSSDSLRRLRATSWRENAWALYFVGSFPESVMALDRADDYLSCCALSECDSAEVKVLRARVYRDLEKLDEAMNLARESASVFSGYGNYRRAAVADAICASVLVHLHRFADALAIDSRIAADASLDEESRASALNRAAYSLRELSAFHEAKSYYARAIAAFERLGLMEKRSMARWGLARVLMNEGNAFESALSTFNELRAEFEELGLAHDLALVSLDAVEALVALERPREVVELCRSAIEYFRNAGLAYSSSAMTALAYLREATERGAVAASTVRDVRTYFEVLPKQPNLLFVFSV